MLNHRWQQECQQFCDPNVQNKQLDVNLFFPRSFCRHCQATIPFWHNIPLLSYIILRGKCFRCKQRISVDYPLVEGLFCLLACLALTRFGLTISLLFALTFIALSMCMSWIDKNQQLLPDELTLSLLWIGLLANINHQFVPLSVAVMGAICGYLSLWLVMRIYWLLRRKIGMGLVDWVN